MASQQFFKDALESVNKSQWTVYGEVPLHRRFKQLYACDIVVFLTEMGEIIS